LSSSELLSSESELSTFFFGTAEGFDTAVAAGLTSYVYPITKTEHYAQRQIYKNKTSSDTSYTQ